MFTATLYKNTGFTLFNPADSEATLTAAASETVNVPTMDILQLYFNKKITIRAFEDNLEGVDFLKLTRGATATSEAKSAFYVVNTYNMTSGDVVEIDVDMEPILTIGGMQTLLNNAEFIDGYVNRHHFPIIEHVEDPYRTVCEALKQAPGEEDPYFSPSYPTKIELIDTLFETVQPMPELRQKGMCVTMCVLSTVDIDAANTFKYDVGNPDSGNGLQTYVNADMVGGNPVHFIIPGIYDDNVYVAEPQITSMFPGLAAYVGELTVINTEADMIAFRKKLIKLVANNMANIIENAWMISGDWVGAGRIGYTKNAKVGAFDGIEYLDTLGVTLADGSNNIQPYIGKYNSLIFVATGSGNVKEIAPENALLFRERDNIVIPVQGNADPRPDGGVTFAVGMKGGRYRTPDNDIVLTDKYDIIEGGKWYKVPINTIGQSGVAINQRLFNAQQQAKDIAAEISIQSGINTAAGGGSIMSNISDAVNRYKDAAASGMGLASIGAMFDSDYTSNFGANGYGDIGRGVVAGNERAITAANRKVEKFAEIAQFNAANCPQPQVVAHASGDLDPYGNALMVFRRSLDDRDLAKYNDVVQRFGVKHTTKFDKSYLYNRRYYNYIEGSGITVRIPGYSKELCNRVSDALNGGIRLWHTKPAAVRYNANPGVEYIPGT